MLGGDVMDDVKLLKLAAKAAGIPLIPNEGVPLIDVEGQPYWNPLTDDGDALRLSVKLKLDVMFFKGFGEVIVESNDASVRCSELYGADTMPATRRAIVRAAAEIGRRAP